MKIKETPQGVKAYASARRQKQKWLTAVICLAALVVFATVYGLVLPAVTLEGETYCGMTEHTHNETCYGSVLVCGLDETEGHVHSESCYGRVLTCTLPEHTHTDSCYVNPNGGSTTAVYAETDSSDNSLSQTTGQSVSGKDTAGVQTGSGQSGDISMSGSNVTPDSAAYPQDQTTVSQSTAENETTVSDNVLDSTGEDTDSPEDTVADETVNETEAIHPQADVEAAALPQGASVPEGYTQRYTVRDDAQGFAVTVYAPEGVIPDGAMLRAQLLNENDDQYAAAEAALDQEAKEAAAQNGVDTLSENGEEAALDYGFAALDIHFEDAQGNEVEPQGDVYVVIDAQKLIPEEADPDTITVVHHSEEPDGQITLETVADTTDDANTGIVDVVENGTGAAASENGTAADVQTAFEVSGFSTFTIRWGKTSERLTIHIIDTKGNEIGGNQEIGADSISSQTTINQIVEMIKKTDGENILEGYKFLRAVVANNEKAAVNISDEDDFVTTIKRSDGNWQYKKADGYSWNKIGKRNLYLIFEDQTSDGGGGGTGGGTVTKDASVNTEKTAVLRDDGNYDLTLSVTGDRGTASNKQKVDVLFVMDVSGSMDNYWGAQGNREQKLTSAKNAIYEISGYGNYDGLSDNSALNVQYALVTFSGSTNGHGKWDDARNRTNGWVDVNKLGSIVSGIGSENGTNYEAGLMIANNTNEISASSSDTIKVVIFLSDGNPGYYYDSDGYTTGTGSPDTYNKNALDRAVNECKKLDTDYFYFVGMTNDLDSKVFTDMVNAVQVPSSNKGSYSANNTDDLMEAFDDIQSQITFFAADHVVMTDPLSQWVDIVPTGENGQVMFEVKLEKQDADGNYVQVGDSKTVASDQSATFTTQAKNDNGQIVDTTFFMTPVWTSSSDDSGSPGTITVTFDADYELAPGYRYSVTAIIKPSDEAIETGENGYDGIGDGNTGTHSGEKGFWSNINDSAKVTYTANSTSGEKTFPKPVVQVPEKTTTTLTLTKTFDGLSDAEVSYLIFRDDGFGFDVNYCVTTAYNSGGELTYMAPGSDLTGIYMPGSNKAMSNGGDYRIVAQDYLNITSIPESGTYTDELTGASLKKNNEDDWVFSITLNVPICDDNHFFTVYEQHAEVPGYAKLNDSNVTYTINSSAEYSGKFVDYGCENGIYEDMPSEVEIDSKFTGDNAREETAIENNRLTHLKIIDDTTIAFTNHYTGKLDVTKVIGDNNDYEEAEETTFTLNIAPAHSGKLTVSNGLSGKTVHYTVSTEIGLSSEVKTATLGGDGSFTVEIQPGQTLHFTDLPAIQWQVTEQNKTVEGYTWNVVYSDTNNNVVNTYSHWNGYEAGETIGGTNATDVDNGTGDGIASVDSAVRDITDHQVYADAVALVTVTNSFDRNAVDITVTKMDGELDAPLSGAEFYLYKVDNNQTKLYYPAAGDAWVTDISDAKMWTSGDDGTFTIEGLEDGTYYLEENKAPDGYVLPENDVELTIIDGAVAYTSVNNPNSYEGTNIKVPNTAGYELPATGGAGTHFMTIGGLLLIAAAVGGGYGLKRRRTKAGK